MRRHEVDVIPDDLKTIFEIADITRVFDYLESTFHVSKRWRAKYRNDLAEVSRNVSEQQFFCVFVREHLEPSLKIITQKQDVLFAIMRYLFKDRINEKKQAAQHLKNFYKSGEWKNNLSKPK